MDRIADVDHTEWDSTASYLRLPVFYSTVFLDAYERHPLADVDAFAYLTAYRDGRPVTVLPAYLHANGDPMGQLAAAYPEAAGQRALLSHSWYCYDTHVAGGPAVALAVVDELRRVARGLGLAWCGLVNVRHDGETAAALAAAGLPLRPMAQRFTAELDGIADLDVHLLGRGRRRAAANLRRYRRRAAEYGVTYDRVAPADADLAGIVALCDRLASRYGTDRFYAAGRFERFVAELGSSAVVLEIRQGGRLVAGGVCLVDDQRSHSWAGGVDYDVDGNFSPYCLLFAETFELAVKLGKPHLEGGRGNPQFKLRHGLTPRQLDACLVATS